mmetsp:Transcript_49951/g.98436  ORF Transcript_49951/g.98436 Transcript_49951/m.98436 type:complete len:108 (-) Transcript_49951:227-550(-)
MATTSFVHMYAIRLLSPRTFSAFFLFLPPFPLSSIQQRDITVIVSLPFLSFLLPGLETSMCTVQDSLEPRQFNALKKKQSGRFRVISREKKRNSYCEYDWRHIMQTV